MNMTIRQAECLFDTALDVLNNASNLFEHSGEIHLTVPKDEYDALTAAVCQIIDNHRGLI